MRYVNVGGPIALGVLGAVLFFALQDQQVAGFDVRVIGIILLVAALLWFVLGAVMNRPRQRVASETTTASPDGNVVERESRVDDV